MKRSVRRGLTVSSSPSPPLPVSRLQTEDICQGPGGQDAKAQPAHWPGLCSRTSKVVLPSGRSSLQEAS